MAIELADPEDEKIVRLATMTRRRTGSETGAAVRDLDGRTYAAAPVDLQHLRLSALALAVAMAVSSGASGLEAAAVSAEVVDEDDLAVLADLAGSEINVIVADADGTPTAIRAT